MQKRIKSIMLCYVINITKGLIATQTDQPLFAIETHICQRQTNIHLFIVMMVDGKL